MEPGDTRDKPAHRRNTIIGFVLAFLSFSVGIAAWLDFADRRLTITLVAAAVGLISLGFAYSQIIVEERESLQRIHSSVISRHEDLSRTSSELRELAGHLGDVMPTAMNGHIKATRRLFQSFTASHDNGQYPVEENSRHTLHFDECNVEDFRALATLGDFEISWMRCEYNQRYEMPGASLEESAGSIGRLLFPISVSTTQAFVEMRRTGILTWESFFPIERRLWRALSDESRNSLGAAPWLIDRTSGPPVMAVELFDSQDRRFAQGQVRYLPLLSPGGEDDRQSALIRHDPRLEALDGEWIDEIFDVYVPSEADIANLDRMLRASHPARVHFTRKLTYNFPAIVRNGDHQQVECCWRYILPIDKVCEVESQTFSISERTPFAFTTERFPDAPTRTMLVRTGKHVASPSMELRSQSQWSISYQRGTYLYPGEMVVIHWVEKPPAALATSL